MLIEKSGCKIYCTDTHSLFNELPSSINKSLSPKEGAYIFKYAKYTYVCLANWAVNTHYWYTLNMTDQDNICELIEIDSNIPIALDIEVSFIEQAWEAYSNYVTNYIDNL